MELLLRGVMVALIGATLAVANIDLEVKIAEQLQHFSDYRFPDAKHKDSWLKAREYIKEQFESYGLAVQTQTFSTTIETSAGDTAVEGTNIIGVARASSDKPGAVLVVGADYDTNTREEPGPLFNNGAGVASLLETSRLFMHSVRSEGVFRLEYTTVFVAFDLNTKEHDSGPGKPGGWYFVNEWLWEYMNQSDTHFGGAYVLDSLMNVNQDKSTQVASEEFHLMFPETYSRIVESNFKGNFLSLVTFPEKKSIDLKEQFSGNYNKLRMRNPFRLEDMTLPNKTAMSELLSELTTQDTIHFWSFTNNGTATPLPAVLVTDTETLRQNPPPPCGSLECPIESWLTEDREDFLVSTVKALTSTLLKRQASRLTDLEIHLKHFEKARCVMAAESEPLERARGYIKDRFADFGLDVKVQRFDTNLRIQGADVKVSGENIVGVSAGAVRGPVLVVGADYDSGLQDSPLENNGAGVAALLEVARLYTQQTAAEGSFVQDRTVVFVALDMNLKEYGGDQTGEPGSYYFLHQWLWDFVNQSAVNFGGAIVLDSITKFSDNPNSQYVFEEFITAFPDASRDIANNSNRGNFIAVFARDDKASNQLSKVFSDNYEKDRRARMVRLQDFPIRNGPSYKGVFEMFNHQSHYPFWSFTSGEEQIPLPAVLITDTGMHRNTEEPCTQTCPADVFLTRKRRAVITNIVDSVTSTLLKLQTKRAERPTESPVKWNGGERSGTTSLALTTFVVFLVVALQ